MLQTDYQTTCVFSSLRTYRTGHLPFLLVPIAGLSPEAMARFDSYFVPLLFLWKYYRDIFDFKAYIYRVTDDMKQDFVGRIDECEQYVSKLIAPPKPADVAKKTCEYCNYRSYCRKELS